jgi:hypothetical protein
VDLPSLTFSTKSSHSDRLSIKTLSTISSASSRLYWRRRQACCTNFYAILVPI